MTLQRRLEGVYRQYGARHPDVAFATTEVLRSAVYQMRGGSAYFAPRGGAASDIVTDMESLFGRSGLSPADAMTLYFQKFIGDGHFYDEREPIDHVTRFDRLVPWVAKTLASDPVAVHGLLRPGSLGRIADWFEATRPDLMSLTLKQVLYRERRWHAELGRAGTKNVEPGQIVFRLDDDWTVQKLSTREQLSGEGGSLAHCIGTVQSYGDYMLSGFADIYSMRDENGVPRYTFYIEKTTRVVDSDLSFRDVPRLSVKQVKGLRNKRPKLAKDCVKILAFLDHLGVPLTDHIDDLEHCLKKAGRWPAPVRQNRRTSRRRTSRRRAA